MFLGEQATVPVGLNAETLEPLGVPAFTALVNPAVTAMPTRKVEACILTESYDGRELIRVRALVTQGDLRTTIEPFDEAFLLIL
jgi:hypothetical protein